MLDIDRFKVYNDTYGHAVGDNALCSVVKAIRAHIKRTDTVGRWGGEEFGIVLPGAGAPEAVKVAERVRQTLASLDLQDASGNRLPSPTVSQGIAACPDHACVPAQLVDMADRALYRAKERGRDQVEVAAPEPQAVSASVSTGNRRPTGAGPACLASRPAPALPRTSRRPRSRLRREPPRSPRPPVPRPDSTREIPRPCPPALP